MVHPVIRPILDHRELIKLKGTYLDALHAQPPGVAAPGGGTPGGGAPGVTPGGGAPGGGTRGADLATTSMAAGLRCCICFISSSILIAEL